MFICGPFRHLPVGSRITGEFELVPGRQFANVFQHGTQSGTQFVEMALALFGRKRGWLVMAWMLIGIGILGTFAAPAGSLEGFIFLTAPFKSQVTGYLEVVTQAVLLSALLCYWVNHPAKKWLNWTLGAAYVIAVGLPLLSLVTPKR